MLLSSAKDHDESRWVGLPGSNESGKASEAPDSETDGIVLAVAGTAATVACSQSGGTTMSRPSPTPDVKARWHSEAIAAIGRRLRIVYLASDYGRIPTRLKRLLRALDRRESEQRGRSGLTAQSEEKRTPHERDGAPIQGLEHVPQQAEKPAALVTPQRR
jgi:hypothetical protein